MNTNRSFVRNRFSQKGFSVLFAVLSVIVAGLYIKFFSTFSIVSFSDIAILAGCFIFLGGSGFLFSFGCQRNVFSAVTSVLLPFLFYDSVRMWKYSGKILWFDVLSVCFGIVLAYIFATRAVQQIQKKSKKKIAAGIIAAKTLRIVCCGLLLVSVILGKVMIKKHITVAMREIELLLSSTEADVYDIENSLSYNIDEVSKIDPDGGWSALSLQEKTDVLETIIRIECRYFGMTDSAPALKIAYLDENTLGEYDYENDELTLSYQYLVDTNASGYSVSQVLLHEMYHRYQRYQTQLLAGIRDNPELAKYERLQLLYDAARYEEEMSRYYSGDGDSALSYYLYASQALERSAERYANSAIYEYYEEIQRHLHG